MVFKNFISWLLNFFTNTLSGINNPYCVMIQFWGNFDKTSASKITTTATTKTKTTTTKSFLRSLRHYLLAIKNKTKSCFLGLWGEIRSWEDGTTIVQKTHDASEHHVLKVFIIYIDTPLKLWYFWHILWYLKTNFENIFLISFIRILAGEEFWS